MSSPLLEVRNLETTLFLQGGSARVVDKVSFDVQPGETLALVGESGCGKTMTAYSIMRLVPDPPGKIVGGTILFQGQNLLGFSEKEMRAVRGNRIAMVFQEPLSSLNPVFRIGYQVSEVLRVHRGMKKKAALEKSVALLHDVGIPAPEKSIRD